MKCEKCLVNEMKHTCSVCKTGYYCSKECQADDWLTHKKFCKLWNKPGKFLNPFYANMIVKEPKSLPIIPINPMYPNYSRDYQGETQIHIAIINGDKNALIDLIKNKKGFVDCIDYRLATPVYYACSHPGKNDILKRNTSLRQELIAILLDAGADPTTQSGFSGMRPHEAAEHYGYHSLSQFITTHKYYSIWKEIHRNFNESSPPKKLEYLVKKMVDLYWRKRTIHWLFALARENMANILPHPKILDNQKIYLERFNGNNSDTIEELFRDCVDRHNVLMECFTEFLR